MRRHVIAVAPDYLLCVVMSFCLVVVALMGFMIDPALQFNGPINGSLCALLQLVLFATSASGAKRKGFVALYVALCILVLGVGLGTSTVPVAVDDEGNHFTYASTLVVVNTLVYLLSRSRARFCALWVAGVLVVAYVQFVFHSNLYSYSVGFLVAAVLLFAYRSYQLTLQAASAKSESAKVEGAVLVTQVVAVGTALAVAAALFFGIVAPLNPGHLTLKLFVVDEALETVEVNHPVRIEKVEDEEQWTENITDESLSGNKSRPVEMSSSSSAQSQAYMEDSLNFSGSQDTYSLDAEEESEESLVTYDIISWLPAIIVAAVLLTLVLAVIGRLVARWIHKRTLASLPPRQQVGAIYREMLSKLGKAGVVKPDSSAPMEFAKDSVSRAAAFSVPFSQSNWAKVSTAYDLVHYGGQEPTAQQLDECWAFYNGFADNMRRQVGALKYAFKYFWVIK